MSVFDIPLNHLSGRPHLLHAHRGRALLIVNVASRCGLVGQYAGLQQLYDDHRDDNLVVIGVPCDQFGGQEPGGPDEIAEFCATRYQVTFPLAEKIDVNGAGRHPLYAVLTATADGDGYAGDVRWNFEKFLVSPDGQAVARFGPEVEPSAPALLTALRQRFPHG